MPTGDNAVRRLQVGTLRLEIHPSREAAGQAAARAAAASLCELAGRASSFGVIFATGASQLATLHALTETPGLPWNQVIGFHMDEYVGIAPDHPASFRRYLRENLTERAPLGAFHGIDGTKPDLESVAEDYVRLLRGHDPQLCLLGIGENGHLAFNDPAEADFADPRDMKLVRLDAQCRQQQVAEGWFPTVDAVPDRALTLTIPALLRVPRLIASVPGPRKAHIVKRTLEEPISTACPATIFRTHPDVTVYLDRDSAAELD
ncbi:MAG TPA: glucosamine-6-phosphate deaminase [Terriglobia bacterium]|nr:glucosamine-6-phosphate deaminase [Terriglobia bacterium]